MEQRLAAATCEVNTAQRERMVKKIEGIVGNLHGKTVGILGLSYKPNTDDVRDSPSIEIIQKLQDRGVRIRCYDPQAMNNARRVLKDVTFCSDPYDTAKECDALVLGTEWNEFRKLDLDRLRQLLSAPVIVDLRNIYEPAEMKRRGYRYTGVGR